MMAAPARAHGPVDGSPGTASLGLIGQQRMAELQRARIIAAMFELVGERGVAGVTVSHIVGRSGVSRRTFYELFHDRDACMLTTFEHGLQRAAAAVVSPYEAAPANASEGSETEALDGAGAGVEGAWEERVRGGLGAVLQFFDREPAIARLLVVDVLAGDGQVLARRARVLKALVDVVHQGGSTQRRGVSGGSAKAGRRPSRVVAEATVGAILAVLYARLSEREPRPVTPLLGQLMAIVVLPYRGAQAAERELRRRAPRARRPAMASLDPLRELDMRLTYRTVRVLGAVAEHPGASSRRVADASGIADQGQISKLLRRLEGLGLIDTDCPTRGGSNAWRLTAKGREVERAIRSQTPGRAPSI